MHSVTVALFSYNTNVLCGPWKLCHVTSESLSDQLLGVGRSIKASDFVVNRVRIPVSRDIAILNPRKLNDNH